MEIRLAGVDDSAALFELSNQLHESISVTRDELDSAFARLLQCQDSVCLVLQMEAEVVGFISGFVRPVLTQGGTAAFIDELVIQPQHRGKGFGTALVAQFEQVVKERACKLVGLATGGATHFYEQLGYQSRAGYYKKTL